jgi:AAA family ATP:ADP antiporter
MSLSSIEKRNENIRFVLVGIAFFFVIAAYTICKELKDVVFMAMVGKQYLKWVKPLAMAFLVPAILFYSYLVNKLKRYQLLYFFAALYGFLGLVFAYFLGDPEIGLPNTELSKMRLFGWLFYFFVEGYSPFVVSVFWSFVNSISTPKSVKKEYGFLVAGSKLGGVATAFGAYWLMLKCSSCTYVWDHQVLVIISSLLLLCVIPAIYLLTRMVPESYLHGYEAAYKADGGDKPKKVGLFQGLRLFVEQPYVFGIFLMLFFYEVINTILNNQRLILAGERSTEVAELSATLFKTVGIIHLITFFVSLIGTSALLRFFGEKRCLVSIPVIIGLLLVVFALNPTYHSLGAVYVIIRIVNNAVSSPIREALYVPTIKEIKFQSKSWIDSFGSKFAKSVGTLSIASAERYAALYGMTLFSMLNVYFVAIIPLWIFASYKLGKRYDQAVGRNETIGN